MALLWLLAHGDGFPVTTWQKTKAFFFAQQASDLRRFSPFCTAFSDNLVTVAGFER
jgi:hypothetical protein